ncbi:MAG: Na(+)-translocating NADH-quinone reductase subunit A [Bacteroidales bacterium]|nr:Na(+)-translocating NADH-quinone reductase subunit A [Bacteroidales bacterium]
MPTIIKLKKGLDIRLKGKPQEIILTTEPYKQVGICPDNLPGFIPKPLIKEGEEVLVGSSLFYHKDIPEMVVASPVSGTLKQIKRGEKRKILSFIIEPDGKQTPTNSNMDISKLSDDDLRKAMLSTGLWSFIIQRPYNIIAIPTLQPKAIFISGFDTAPLAPNLEFILHDEKETLQAGINVLKRLVDVPIYVGLKSNTTSVFEQINGIHITYFDGPHPAGNVGIHIHHVSPINKGEIVWTIRPEDLVIIGRYELTGMYDVRRTIAVVGSQVKQPAYVKTIQGADIATIVKNNIYGENNRYISGNVLTGKNATIEGFLGFYDRMISVIPEGDRYEFLGWAMPGFNKFSLSRTFFSWLFPKKEYVIDTNYHGGERAYVMTGQYEKVLPMDILPQHLIKAALSKDIELLEKLGIYEVVEEDLALCEFVCTSKIEVQHILREALDFVRKEMS